MKYALNLAEDGRILSATFEKYASSDAVLVDELPGDNIYDFRYVDGEFIEDPVVTDPKKLAEHRIHELKQKLADTDYNILKIVEGVATPEEMADIISKRSKWREEINELEKDLA
jgi:hypothetical protein